MPNTPGAEDHGAYEAAQKALAAALVQVWRACDDLDYELTRDDGSTVAAGQNLPECLSYALGMAAKTIWRAQQADDAGGGRPVRVGFGLDDAGNRIDSEQIPDETGEILVRHRPGSWEAEHVLALVYPLDLIPDEAV